MSFDAGKREVDGRWVAVACLLSYFAILFVAHFHSDYKEVWRNLGVPAADDSFEDLRSLMAGARTAQAGFDPITHPPVDYVGERPNYPDIWFQIILGLHLQRVSPNVLGVILGAGFFTSVLFITGRLALWQGAAWGVLLCLPPVMLAVERGNNDLVIFILLAMALSLRRLTNLLPLAIAYGLIEACALLKLYPAIVLGLALRERPRWGTLVFTVCGFVFAMYLFLIRVQVREIHAVVPHPFTYAFGRNVFADRYDRTHPGVIPHAMPFLAVIGVLTGAAVAGLCSPRLPGIRRVVTERLVTGGLLYVSIFSLNANSNYRLIFLLFALPALIELAQDPGFYRRLVVAVLLALALGWTLANEMHPALFFIKELGNWIVLAGMAFLVFQCLQPCIRSYAEYASNYITGRGPAET